MDGNQPRPKQSVVLAAVKGDKGTDHLVLRARGNHVYLYWRRYVGVTKAGKPKYQESYLRPVPDHLIDENDRDQLVEFARRVMVEVYQSPRR